MAITPPSATATPTSAIVPWAVVARSSTMECPAAWAEGGTVFCGPARVVMGPAATVSPVEPEPSSGCWEAGESRTMKKATTAATAATPIRAMNAVRERWREGALRSIGLSPPGAISLGWRHSRSSGSIHPRCAGFGPLGAGSPRSSGPGSPSRGSSGVSLTTSTIPRTALEVPSLDGPAVP